MEVLRRGEGPGLCIGTARNGAACTHHEVEGLEYCVWHMPDELLEEAEEITGWKRCRLNFGVPEACHYAAVKGTRPPRCKNHGANAGSVISQQASANVVSDRAADRLVAILGEYGDKLLDPDPIGNPLQELMELAAEIKAFKEIMRQVTSYLFSQQRLRSAHAKVGEQLRSEILLYERAQERLAKILMDIGKLGIEQILVRIDVAQYEMIERAFDLALEKAPLDLVAKDDVRAVLRRELMRAAS
jgi:hypothetical protein